MRRALITLGSILCVLSCASSVDTGLGVGVAVAQSERTDAEIRQLLIEESIEGYPGPCACPYQRASNGSLCGRRSAYSRGDGYAPLCYDRDVTDEAVQQFREDEARQ